MSVMLMKADPLSPEADERLGKTVHNFEVEGEAVPDLMTGVMAPSKGEPYVLHYCDSALVADGYPYDDYPGIPWKAAKNARLHQQTLWGEECFTGPRELIGLFDIKGGVEPLRGMIVLAGTGLGRARPQLRSAPDLYPELDIPGIEERAKELRECATDSEAISRVLNKPVQIVHQAE